ncbi:hypothetical protein [Embleya hyalina]|uniref:hypothetical protein n=1 Tax=Embleya hyalina TaxID=516124 RepID=UPI001C3F63C4|nr:hypothetical protein [Embleya hyalina]
MARRVIEVVQCDACAAKGEEVPASDELRLGTDAWDLCGEHANRFAGWFRDLFEMPTEPEADEDEPGPDVQEDDEKSGHPTGPAPTVVITGSIPGYHPHDAADAVRSRGYVVVDEIGPDTSLIVCGDDPSAALVRAARKAATGCFDAATPGAFARAISAGRLPEGDELPSLKRKSTRLKESA